MPTKKVDLHLARAPESKGHGHIDQLLVWVSGSLLVLMVLVGSMDILDFLLDPSQHAIGQGSNAGEAGWQLRYLITGLCIVVGAVAALGLLFFYAKNPQKRWTAPVQRIVSATIIGVVVIGYIIWDAS